MFEAATTLAPWETNTQSINNDDTWDKVSNDQTPQSELPSEPPLKPQSEPQSEPVPAPPLSPPPPPKEIDPTTLNMAKISTYIIKKQLRDSICISLVNTFGWMLFANKLCGCENVCFR